MTEKTQIWQATANTIKFLNRPFRFTHLQIESGTNSDGDNRLVRQQQALLSLLKTGECSIPDQEMQMAIIQQLLITIKKDEQLSKLGEKDRNILIQAALRQLPLQSQMQLSIMSPSSQTDNSAKKSPLTKRPAFKSAAEATRKNHQTPTPAIPAHAHNDNDTRAQKRVFSLLHDHKAINSTRIFFGQDEIIIDDIDEHTVLTTILDMAQRGKTVSNATIEFKLGGGVNLSQIYMGLKQSMKESAIDSANALKYDPKTKKHTTNAIVERIQSEQDLYVKTGQNASIALPPVDTPKIFGS